MMEDVHDAFQRYLKLDETRALHNGHPGYNEEEWEAFQYAYKSGVDSVENPIDVQNMTITMIQEMVLRCCGSMRDRREGQPKEVVNYLEISIFTLEELHKKLESIKVK